MASLAAARLDGAGELQLRLRREAVISLAEPDVPIGVPLTDPIVGTPWHELALQAHEAGRPLPVPPACLPLPGETADVPWTGVPTGPLWYGKWYSCCADGDVGLCVRGAFCCGPAQDLFGEAASAAGMGERREESCKLFVLTCGAPVLLEALAYLTGCSMFCVTGGTFIMGVLYAGEVRRKIRVKYNLQGEVCCCRSYAFLCNDDPIKTDDSCVTMCCFCCSICQLARTVKVLTQLPPGLAEMRDSPYRFSTPALVSPLPSPEPTSPPVALEMVEPDAGGDDATQGSDDEVESPPRYLYRHYYLG